MNRTAWLFAAATAAAAVALIPSGAAGWIPFAAAAALGASALSRGLPRGWGLRSAFLLLGAYLALLGWFRLESWNLARGGGEAAAELEESKRQRVAEVFARRIEDDRALLDATVASLERLDVTASGPEADADLFRALDRGSPPALPAGIGFEVYDRDGRLRAWWGDPRGDRLPPDSVATTLEHPLVRAPFGYRMAYVAAPWIAAGQPTGEVDKEEGLPSLGRAVDEDLVAMGREPFDQTRRLRRVEFPGEPEPPRSGLGMAVGPV